MYTCASTFVFFHIVIEPHKTSLSSQVYCIGGDGTMRGVLAIFKELQRRKLNISITGIPKTVDNDIGIIDRSFGFQTAVEMALHSTLSSRDVDCCLIPETEFYLEGKGGLFEFLDQTLKQNGHAVIVVAEGAGQDMIPRTESQKEERDESGNPVFLDVGPWGPINGNYGYIPVEEVASAKNVVDTKDHKWAWVRSVTNQPDFQKG
ncbi:ATP-dependent 6-phosphofructokinase 2-like [Asparagus officinalis]|uniref:ATP-dependent 6-phosphofructokinase 2-like n=1 Tax=Asparagus officinalis TaxID=4686 RepID=UPI00098E0570|nr:ATP-dependent 6-phosphofructokinase 2-like [Asparagus officinalis]